jgi:hypothetical protein
MASILRPRHLALIVAAAMVAGCVESPASAARTAQQFNDIGDQLNDLRQENAAMQSSLDSIRIVLAKHDITLVRVANATGVVVAK